MKNIIIYMITIAPILMSFNNKIAGQVIDSESKKSIGTSYSYLFFNGGEKPKLSKENTNQVELTQHTLWEEFNSMDAQNTTSLEGISAGLWINTVLRDYLKLKNALVKDDSAAASFLGQSLYSTFYKIDSKLLDAESEVQYLKIAADAITHAKHIGNNSGKISHQRQHFVFLSNDIYALLKIFKTDQKIYRDYCPMANGGKGAIWISEMLDIQNPYFGSAMRNCGELKEVL